VELNCQNGVTESEYVSSEIAIPLLLQLVGNPNIYDSRVHRRLQEANLNRRPAVTLDSRVRQRLQETDLNRRPALTPVPLAVFIDFILILFLLLGKVQRFVGLGLALGLALYRSRQRPKVFACQQLHMPRHDEHNKKQMSFNKLVKLKFLFCFGALPELR